MTPRTKEIIGISAILAVAVFFCLFHIKESPPVWFDEGIYIQAAGNLASSGVAGFIVSPEEIVTVPQLSVGYPLLYPLAAVFKLWGAGVLQARLLMVLFVTILVIAAYMLVRMTYGRSYAFWAAALLALFPPLYGTGKSVLGEVPGTLFFILAMVFLAHAVMSLPDGRRRLRIVGAGLCAGLAIVTKPVFILILPALVIAAALTWKRWRASSKQIIVGLVALALPVIVWLITQFLDTGSLTETLLFYSNPSHVGNMTAIILSNLKNFMTDIGPLTLLVVLVIWTVALVIRVRNKVSVHFVEIISYTLCLISVAAFLRTAGYYRYLLPYQLISLIFFPHSLTVTVQAIREKFLTLHERLSTFSMRGIIVLMLLVGTYQLFFNSWVADSYGSTRTKQWEEFFSSSDITRPVFYYDVPEVTMFDPGGDYYQYINMAPAAGISVGNKEREVLEQGIPKTVIVQTALYQEHSGDLFLRYHPLQEIEKYTILNLLP